MSFFVDANVILYSAVDGDYREACEGILDAVVAGAEGRTTAAVLEEVWHVERSGRLGSGVAGLTAAAFEIFTPLLLVTDEAFAMALALDADGVGTNDRVHAATCRAHGIEAIVTADRGFDGIAGVRRVDPLDAPAVTRLLG